MQPDLRPEGWDQMLQDMPSSGLYFPKEEGENPQCEVPSLFPLWGSQGQEQGIIPVCCLLWALPCSPAQAARAPSLAAGLLRQPSRWAVATGIAGREADVFPAVPRHNWRLAAWGGDLHNKDNLVPKLSPEVNCLDLVQLTNFTSSFPCFVRPTRCDVQCVNCPKIPSSPCMIPASLPSALPDLGPPVPNPRVSGPRRHSSARPLKPCSLSVGPPRWDSRPPSTLPLLPAPAPLCVPRRFLPPASCGQGRTEAPQ